jgi:FkbM family methyltransferase
MFSRLESLKRFGFNPTNIIDIGANIGQWNLSMKNIYPNTHIKSYEANQECELFLANNNIDYTIALLGNTNKRIPFYKLNNSLCTTGASIYLETTSYYNEQTTSVSQLTMQKLDDLYPSNTHVDLIKIDTQGSELDILSGAGKILNNTDFVLLEISIMRYNINAPLFSDVIIFMKNIGFNVFDIVENQYISDLCVQTNVIFLNSNSSWCDTISKMNTDLFSKTKNIYE